MPCRARFVLIAATRSSQPRTSLRPTRPVQDRHPPSRLTHRRTATRSSQNRSGWALSARCHVERPRLGRFPVSCPRVGVWRPAMRYGPPGADLATKAGRAAVNAHRVRIWRGRRPGAAGARARPGPPLLDPEDRLRLGPVLLELVEIALRGREHVDDDRPVVQEDPVGGGQPLPADRLQPLIP